MNPQDSARVLAQLRRDAESAGLLGPAGRGYALRLAGCAPLLVGLAWVAWSAESIFAVAVASALAAVVSVQIGFVAHDAGHAAVSRRAWINGVAGHLAFSVVNGLGFESWKTSHDEHHAYSQDASLDPDMQVDVVLSLTPASALQKTGLGRFLLPFQGYYLWPVSTLFAHSLRLQSLGRSFRAPLRYRLDTLLVPLHYAFWFGLPLLWLETGVGRVFTVYLILSAVVGSYLALVFWVNHVGMPALSAGHGLTVVEQQVVGTRNVRTPPAFDWLFGGLNFQIEHHLLPACPGARLRQAQPLAQGACQAQGLPYFEERFGQAVASVTRHVAAIARH